VSLNWILIVAGALLILLEVLLGAISGFDLLLIGSAILLGGVLGLATNSATLGMATAGVLALIYVFLGRKKIRSRLGRPNLRSNTDALLGREVRVTEAIGSDHAGRIRFEGDEWRALPAAPSGEGFAVGTTVRIERIDGVTVYVRPLAG
jgi:membrane protein implicated in regulation of membrane protease activity